MGPGNQFGKIVDAGREPGCLLFPLLRVRPGSHRGNDEASHRSCEVQRPASADPGVRYAQLGRVLARTVVATRILIFRFGVVTCRAESRGLYVAGARYLVESWSYSPGD